MLLKLTPFGGIVPRTGTRLLGDTAAQVANNVKLQSGEIRPLRQPALVNTPNKLKPAMTIFRAWFLEQNAWMSFPFDADIIRVPLSADVESRFVWTGDGQPKIATYSDVVLSGNNDYPSNGYALGVAPPVNAPTVGHSGGVGAATTRVYTYTFFSALGEESAPAPVTDLITGKIDDTWAISGMDALPVNSGSITNITYAGSVVTITSGVQHYNRVGESITVAGVSTVSNVNGTWTLTAVNPLTKTMTFKVTGVPAGVYSNATDSADTWARVVNFNVSGMKRRLYRSTGLTGTIQLVSDDVGITYNDTLSDAAILGDELISSGWEQPPVNLQGVKVHSSGSLIGFVGNTIHMSEPYQPHAWVEAYQLSTDRDIVALACFGSEIGVGTKGTPWLASGVDPISMSLEKLTSLYPCVAKRSLIEFSDGLVYASAHGIVYVGPSGVRLLSEPFYTKDEWQALNPETMTFASAYGRLYWTYTRDDGTQSMMILDGDLLVSADVVAKGLYADPQTSELFVSDSEGIKIWDDANSYPLNASWQSKDFVVPAPVNPGAAKIEFDAAIDPATQAAIQAAIAAAEAYNATLLLTGNVNGSINSFSFNENFVSGTTLRKIPDNPPANQVTFILRKNQDEIVVSRVVTSNKAFRLPAGYKSDVFSIQVLGQCPVREIRIAETMDGLRVA